MSGLTKVCKALGINGVELRPNAMVLRKDLDNSELDEVFEFLSTVDSCRLWWWGDFLIAAGDRMAAYRFAKDDSGYEFQTLANAKWVCSRVNTSRRREVLSFNHYLEIVATLGKAASDAEIDRWAKWTEKNGTNGKPASVRDLRQALRSRNAQSTGGFQPLASFTSISRRFQGLAGTLDVSSIGPAEAEAILQDLRPILVFVQALQLRLESQPIDSGRSHK